MNTRWLGLAAGLVMVLALSGCLGPVAESDRFSSDKVVAAPAAYGAEDFCAPLPGETPCRCLVCSNDRTLAQKALEKIPWVGTFIEKLVNSGTLEGSLSGAQCEFLACNNSMFMEYLGPSVESGASGTCLIKGTNRKCLPRMFMIGQGPNGGEYALAQRYCAGRLQMPVLWATPGQPAQPVRAPAGSKLVCYLSRDQLPVVVWDDGGQADALALGQAVRAYYRPPESNAVPVDGPVVFTTSALLDPYVAGDADRKIDIAKLQKVGAQVEAIRNNCKDCFVALAIRPTFGEDGRPDLCPLDYLLNDSSDTRENGCRARYSDPSAYERRGQWADPQRGPAVDLIGVGFMANEEKDIPSCSAEGEVGKYLYYSRSALQGYLKPSVWYAVGIAPGQTATPNCWFSELDVANAYNSMMSGIPGFASSGVIGFAPYRFLDSPEGAPRPCPFRTYRFATASASLDDVQSGKTLGTADGTARVAVARVVKREGNEVVFVGTDGESYSARLEGGALKLYELGCQYGFRDVGGNLRNQSAYAWFSSCQFYYTNRAPPAPGQEGPGMDTPLAEQATQQPVMFSANGKGGAMCAVFNANKMLQRGFTAQNSLMDVPELKPPSDPAEQRRISSLQCGACLSESPMPRAFCSAGPASAGFPKEACTDYPRIDDAALLKGMDPVLLRAISVGETVPRLGTAPEHNGPACSMGPSALDLGNDNLDFASLQSDVCDGNYLAAKAQVIRNTAGRNHVAGMGLLQCIRHPDGSYNPFNPYDSAACGASEFSEKNNLRYNGRLIFLQQQAARPPAGDLFDPQKGGIGPGEMEWYAAWLAAQAYHGEKIEESWLTGYAQRSADDTLVKYVLDRLTAYCDGVHRSNPDAECVPNYGLMVIKRYNKGIDVCQNGCDYRDC